ncbi:MAG: CvpA family protein [Gemmataceae bacterium]|nr:CvpA family protein [Gemmataceae bacterium]
MYWLDTTILAVLGIGALFGAVSGLLMQLARLIGFAIALYVAICFNADAAALTQRWFVQEADPRVAQIVAYVGVFLLVYLGIFLFTLILERGMRAARLQGLNRVLGALLGATKVGLILGAVFLALEHVPNDATQQMVQRSTIAPVLARGTESLVVALANEYPDEVRSGLQNLGKSLPRAADLKAWEGSDDSEIP